MIDARCLEEQTARAGTRPKREDVCSGNSKRLAVIISVDVGQIEESTLLTIIEAIYFILTMRSKASMSGLFRGTLKSWASDNKRVP